MKTPVQEIIDRASREPEFMERLIADPLGTASAEGYEIDMDELRFLMEMPNADQQALEDALKERLAHSGSTKDGPRGIIPPGGSL